MSSRPAMDYGSPDSTDTSESDTLGGSCGQSCDSSGLGHDPKLFWQLVTPFESRQFMANFKALIQRFIHVSHRPEQLAPLILDFWSLSLSIAWTTSQSGPDLLYPFSSPRKLKSGRLARLLLEHCRDSHFPNLRVTTSPIDGVDPPRVAVIDLDEVPPEVLDRGYTVSADFYGFVVMVLFLETVIMLLLRIFSPIDITPYYRWLGEQMSSWFGQFGAWPNFFACVLSDPVVQWINYLAVVVVVCLYAVLRGEGTLTLVRRSDISAPSCAVLLDRDFTVILTGTQCIVEAIAESSFSISHPLSRRYHVEAWQFGRHLFYEAQKASFQGVPYAILAGFWLQLCPASFLTAIIPLVFTVVASSTGARDAIRMARAGRQGVNFIGFSKTIIITSIRPLFRIAPTFLLVIIYELAIVKHPILRSVIQPTIWIHFVPVAFIMVHFIASRNYRIRTTKLLDILGPPPIRRWEFDTLAAAATFQCLVVCRGIPRPIKRLNVLAVLDTLVPDQTDVWAIWKARVADRIANEVEISFAPTIPSFGDQRQKHLKELLDQAQSGYDSYRRFYDWHVPLYSTVSP